MTRSRIPHFYKMSVAERVRAVRDRGLLSDTDFDLLSAGQATLDLQAAVDRAGLDGPADRANLHIAVHGFYRVEAYAGRNGQR